MSKKISVTKLSKMLNKDNDNIKLGNEIHELIENYLITFNENIFKNKRSFEKQINSFLKDRKELEIFKTELKITEEIITENKSFIITGKIDAVFFNKYTQNFVLIDWKISKNYEKNYQYEDSLRLYKLLFEKKYNRIVEEICLIYLYDNQETYIPIQVKIKKNDLIMEKLNKL